MALTLEDVKKFLEEKKDDEAVKTYLSALKAPKEFTKEDFEKYLVTEEGKALMKSKTDQACTNAINTFKEKTMPGLITEAVNAKVKELHPDETPEQKSLREMNDKIDSLTKERNKERLEKLVLQSLSNAKLPDFASLMSLFVGNDESETIANIEKLQNAVKKEVEKQLKENLPGRETPGGSDDEEKDPNFKNPFSAKYFNLTEQGKLYKKNPELARKLQAEAAA